MDNKPVKQSNNKEKKMDRNEYLKKYYQDNKDLWKPGNKYHRYIKGTEIKGFSKIEKKIVVRFN